MSPPDHFELSFGSRPVWDRLAVQAVPLQQLCQVLAVQTECLEGVEGPCSTPYRGLPVWAKSLAATDFSLFVDVGSRRMALARVATFWLVPP